MSVAGILPVLGDQGGDGDLLLVKDALSFEVVGHDLGGLHCCAVDLGQIKVFVDHMLVAAFLLNIA